MARNTWLWIFWVALTLGLAGTAMARIYLGGDRTVLLPGQTAGAHHQLEIACETCHTSKPFASPAKVKKDINKTCQSCHKEELDAFDDSHPKKKFTNPRMAPYWEKIDGRFCTTCHAEHLPEVTLKAMVTLPADYCVACHSQGEQDIRKDRESHAGLTFDTCASAGCHNYHDNKAIYEDFLVKHADAPWLSETPVLAAAALPRPARAGSSDDIAAYLAGADAPADARDAEIDHDWAASAHAVAEVGCASCHAPKAEDTDAIAAAWVDAPDAAICTTCHKAEAKSFSGGRHGMRMGKIGKPREAKKTLKALGWKDAPDSVIAAVDRLLPDPTPPAAMSTAEARVSLRDDAHGRDLTCNTCHAPHKADVDHAAVGACLTCHDDDHTLAYEGSPHHDLWLAELSGELPPGSGVSCATCHMPQAEAKGKAVTNHNQNDTLRPNEKMIRPVCMDCHGLGFAIDALADPALIANNFTGPPSRHIESIDWALKRVEQPEQGANQ